MQLGLSWEKLLLENSCTGVRFPSPPPINIPLFATPKTFVLDVYAQGVIFIGGDLKGDICWWGIGGERATMFFLSLLAQVRLREWRAI